MAYSEEQVRAAQRGDTAAFDALVTYFHPLAHALAWSRTGDADAADDISQEAWLVVWANFGRLRHPKAFPVWLRKIVVGCANNWVRNTVYRRKLAEAMARVKGVARADDASPAEAVAKNETRDKLSAAIKGLSPKLRLAMTIHFIEGCTVLEGAAVLGIREDAMRKRLHMGCDQLRAQWFELPRDTTMALDRKKKVAASNVLAGIAMGPAVPGFGRSAASFSQWNMALRHVLDGGSLVSLHTFGLATSFVEVVIVLAVALTAVGAAGLRFLPASHDAQSAAMQQPQQRNSGGYEGSGIAIKGVKDPVNGQLSHLLVLEVLPGHPAAKAGLQDGDRILPAVVDGKPCIPPFRGPAGTSLHLTALRTQPNGTEVRMDFEIVRDFIPASFAGKYPFVWLIRDRRVVDGAVN